MRSDPIIDPEHRQHRPGPLISLIRAGPIKPIWVLYVAVMGLGVELVIGSFGVVRSSH